MKTLPAKDRSCGPYPSEPPAAAGPVEENGAGDLLPHPSPAPSSIVVTAAQAAIAYQRVEGGYVVETPPPIVANLNLASGVGDLEAALHDAVKLACEELERQRGR